MALSMIVALAIGVQAQSPTPNLLDWQAFGGSGAIQSAIPFTIKNVTDKETLRYGKRVWGIDLVWDKSETLNNLKFEKQTGSGDVKYDELIAISVNGGGYLKYEKTRFGINLVFSATPAYEWRVGGGEVGQPVKFGEQFALMSEVEHDVMIYGKRPVGINLVWMKDFYKSTWDRIKAGVVSELKDDKDRKYLLEFLGLLISASRAGSATGRLG
jgi:hypothetical protein